MAINDTQFDELKMQLNRMERALVGDEAMGHQGMVHRVANLDTRVSVIESERRSESEQKKGALWVITSTATAAGTVGAILAWIGLGPKN
jgi:hypothetical protein